MSSSISITIGQMATLLRVREWTIRYWLRQSILSPNQKEGRGAGMRLTFQPDVLREQVGEAAFGYFQKIAKGMEISPFAFLTTKEVSLLLRSDENTVGHWANQKLIVATSVNRHYIFEQSVLKERFGREDVSWFVEQLEQGERHPISPFLTSAEFAQKKGIHRRVATDLLLQQKIECIRLPAQGNEGTYLVPARVFEDQR